MRIRVDPDPKHCLLVQVLTPLSPHLHSFHVDPDFARMRIRIRNCEIISMKVPLFSVGCHQEWIIAAF
jgi:hypothetical protein